MQIADCGRKALAAKHSRKLFALCRMLILLETIARRLRFPEAKQGRARSFAF